ncbi:class I SAM-dependent methyltransferase [Nocardia mangyaensis]|uniref:class I SAM-dependent methyltransferase n=1 Tax=Nocardia mangyaensis TaxID=2213200 RepID=UPI002674D696|nr:class I SAM-dependent methyltransferase [Nocardia mangyaensis]MDO3648079.1 class I SAM-dependent methyltransferase [Nocardia mangyaensis]
MPDNTVRAAYTAVNQLYIDLFGSPTDLDPAHTAFALRHLTEGPVLDLGCGPGHFTKVLTDAGTPTTGIDLVPEFITHARTTYPTLDFELGCLRTLNTPPESVAGILAWFSLIHIPPPELPAVLTEFHRVLRPGGHLVLGFFDTEDEVEEFPHKVIPAYRWPVDELAYLLAIAGFTELERFQHPASADTRRHAALALVRSRTHLL